jgi:hypothetical protein
MRTADYGIFLVLQAPTIRVLGVIVPSGSRKMACHELPIRGRKIFLVHE